MTNYEAYKKFRLSLQCFASILTVCALSLTLAAMFTSGWQVVYANDRQFRIYEQGLSKDCLRRDQSNVVRAVGSNEWTCFWKLNEWNPIQPNRIFRLKQYQTTVLILLGVSCGLALLTLTCAFATCCFRLCNAPWAVSSLLTSVTSLVGIIVFVRNSTVSNNQYMDNYYNNGNRFYPMDYDVGAIGNRYYPLINGYRGGGQYPYPLNNNFRGVNGGFYPMNAYRGGGVGYNAMDVLYDDSLIYGMSSYEGNLWYGESFYMSIAGFVAYALVTIVAAICVCFSFLEVRQKQSSSRVLTRNNSFLTSTDVLGSNYTIGTDRQMTKY